ncbi:MAG: SDR family oxidoreductase, partial [Chloroflexia bacterium]|nr:SDR family oxidoreductase [Chloroflexia bacterium]
ILVNNAGLSVGADVARLTSADWDRNFDVVIKAAFLCSRAVLPTMIEARRGVILNIASVNGMFGIGEDAYSAAKAGLLNLTQNMAMRYGKNGIRVNAISPGTIRTPIWDERLARDPDVFDSLNAWYALGRVGEVEDVTNAALFLCSSEASWITGVNLPVDGGLTAGSVRMIEDLGGG